MIEAITFDVGGTLADGDLDKKEFMERVLDYLSGLGFQISKRAYKCSLGRAMNKLQALRSSGREMDFDSFYSLVLSGIGVQPNAEILADLRSLYFQCFRSELIRGAREVLERLSGRYRLAVISNALTTWPKRFLEAEGLAKYFEFILVSCEVGWRKPHKAIFQVALDKLGLEPGAVVHVGDSPSEDIMGAKGVGMRAILVLRSGLAGGLETEPDATIRQISELPEALEGLDP